MHKVAKGKHRYRKYIDEPVMSDRTLLVSVEDLIASAFGPFEKNTVNFKLVQTILHILARQLRLLEQDVEIKFDELGVDIDTGRIRSDHDAYDRSDGEYSDEYDAEAYFSSSEEEEEGKDATSVRGREGRPDRKERGHKGEKREKKERGEKEEKREKGRGEKGGKGEKKELGEKVEKGEKDRVDKGENGEKKERGEKGKRGEEKVRGEKGDKGEKERGEKREKGETERGEKGEKGETERGEEGEKGETERGEKGEKGEKKQGEKGEIGETKERGDKGEKRRDKRGGKDIGITTVLGDEEEGDEAEGRGGHARHGKRGRKGEDDVEEGEGAGGRRLGGRGKRDEVEGDEAEGEGVQRRGGRGKRGEVEGDEAVREGGQQRGGRGKRGEVEGDEAKGEGGQRRGGQGKRGEVEGDEAEGKGGRQRGVRGKRGDIEGDEAEEGGGRRHGGRGRRDEDEGEEAEAGGRRQGGHRRDREDRGADRHEEKRDERLGERRGEYDESEDRDGRQRREERGGEYDVSEDRGGRRRDGREGSGTSITVSEATRRGDGKGGTGKVLVAERGPATHGSVTRVGSIEVVTASQFALLKDAVKRLEKLSGPLPMPALPDNEQLRKDLAKGRASLSDTMEAVQLNARVQAAEEGLSRMAGLLTQLAAAGALPPDFASRIGDLKAALRKPSLTTEYEAPGLPFDFKAMFGHGAGAGGGAGAVGGAGASRGAGAVGVTGVDKGAGAGPKSTGPFARDKEAGTYQADQWKSVEPSTGRSAEPGGDFAPGEAEPSAYEAMHVTRSELQDILEQMKARLNREIQSMTARANHSVDMASNTSRSVSDKLAIALTIDDRVSNLYQQTADYAIQLNGFDTGLNTQMASFQEQMTTIRTDLSAGLDMLKTANNNAETAAVLDLTERYENLVVELENTTQMHANLNILQQNISGELKSLVECVEMLREQKADRDEVLDCLRDKADISRLAGLLYEKDFAQARFEIDERIEKSYEKFYKQDEVWKNALRDLTQTCDNKAELISLMGLKNKATQDLNAIKEKLHQLEIMLGEPQAALLTRQLAAGAACGACLMPAVMAPVDATHSKPMALPALRPPPLGAEDLCLGGIVLRPPDTREHICHRWVGGSHTLVAGNISREKAGAAQLQTIPTKKFEAYGFDGKLYMMEEELQPCAECNKFSTDEDGKVPPHSTSPTGGGDQA